MDTEQIRLVNDSPVGWNFAQAKPAWIATWRHMVLGLIAAVIFAIVGLLLAQWGSASAQAHPFWASVLRAAAVVFEDIAIGFVVASVAVFGFEWGSRGKHSITLAQQLAEAVNEVGPMCRATAKSALERGLKTLLIDTLPTETLGQQQEETARACKEQLTLFAEAIFELQSDRSWANYQYVRFLERLLRTVVGQNAQALKELKGGTTVTFLVPKSSADIADMILTAQMQAMEAKDSYDVISDLISWRDDQLRAFLDETDRAIGRGVHVRRVFNMLRPDDGTLSDDDVQKILAQHVARQLASQHATGKYSVAVFDWPDLQRRALPKGIDNNDIQSAHFGIFKHSGAAASEICLRFNVVHSDLHEMSLCKNRQQFEDDITLFEHMWGNATRLVSMVADGSTREATVTDVVLKRKGSTSGRS